MSQSDKNLSIYHLNPNHPRCFSPLSYSPGLDKFFTHFYRNLLDSFSLFQLNCTPTWLNTFDQLNVSQCSSPNIDETNLKTIFSNSMNIITFCDHCLPPCSKHYYRFNVELIVYIFILHLSCYRLRVPSQQLLQI